MIHGVHPILYAMFDVHGALDRDAMRLQVDTCIAHGCDGIAVLGLATEVAYLQPHERRTLLDWTADDVAGRVPLGVTVFGNSVAEQASFVAAAADAGATWVILQPPREPSLEGEALLRFFGEVADASQVPVAIQHAPELIGSALEDSQLADLAQQHPNVRLLKAEAAATEIAALHAIAGDSLTLIAGRGGLELPDLLRAGCAGIIPAPDCFDHHIALVRAFRAGDVARAEALYAAALPAMVFAMQSLTSLVCYGKRIAAFRMGLETVHDRSPGVAATPYGIECSRRYAKLLGSLV